jgi:hypothetical protein
MKVQQGSNVTLTADNLQAQLDQVTKALSANISFGSTTGNTDGEQNTEGWKATGTTPAVANTEFTVAHGLGRVPMGFIVLLIDKAGIIYKGATAWTDTDIFLKCNVASVAYYIFIV